jgi:spermidine synthase
VLWTKTFPCALFVTFLSGAAGLAHQILWTRRMVDVLGASADTFSKVVGAFFIGLALGAWLASRGRSGVRSFWNLVALAELAVAALATLVLFSPAVTDGLSRGGAPGWSKALLPPLLVTPPALAMGLVLPWMVRALALDGGFLPRQAVWVYAVNTLGGVAGVGFVVLDGLPRLGLDGASLAAIALNLVAAAGALWLNFTRRSRREAAQISQSAIGNPPSAIVQNLLAPAGPRGWMPLLAFASGFLVLALEVILQHQLAQVTINSLFSGGLVLALVLVSLTAAALLAPVLVRWAGDEQRALAWALFASAVLCAAQPFLLTGWRAGVNILPYELPPASYLLEVLRLGALAVCPMLLAGGLVFPMLLRRAVAEEGGRRVGVLFAWNGLGGWLGAESGQALLAPGFGLWQSVMAVAASYAALWAMGHWRRTRDAPTGSPRVHRLSSMTHSTVLMVALLAGAWFARALPQAAVAPAERLHAFRVGREGAVAVVECGPGDWRMLFNNSYTLGGSKAQCNQERQGLLPLLLHGQVRSVATLGVATGGTVAGAALSPHAERIDAIELSPLVLRYAEQFFAPYNRDVFRDPRVRFIAEDARWVMARRTAAYDVVVGDLFLPWRTGEGRLFAREHFHNVRRALKPGGVFCQWLPLFQLTRPQFETIARTFLEVFPDAFLVRGDFYAELPILGLVGGRDFRRLDWPAIQRACDRLRAASPTTDPLVRHADGVAMLLLGPLPDPGPGAVNTLANAWLEWNAGRNIVGLQTPWFIGVPLAEYVRDRQRAGQTSLPESRRAAHEAGQFCLTLEIAAKLNLPVLGDLKSQLNERLPPSLRDDPQADWSQWPMRIKPALPAHTLNPSSR